jgi:hypothetical protein
VTIAELTLDLPALANALDAYLMDPALGVNVRANELVFLQLQWAWVRQSRTLLGNKQHGKLVKLGPARVSQYFGACNRRKPAAGFVVCR